MLNIEQIDAYNRDGYLKVEGLFSQEESAELASEMVRIIEEWAAESAGRLEWWSDGAMQMRGRNSVMFIFLQFGRPNQARFNSSREMRVNDRRLGAL